MKLIEVYLSKKEKYFDSVILIESGIFIEVFGDETSIINRLLGYKITSSSNMLKLGFPRKVIDKVLLVLRSKHINYLVLDKEGSILDKKKYKDNKYLIMLDLKDEELHNLSIKDRVVSKYMSEIERVNENPEFHEFMSAEEDNRKIENSLRIQYTNEGIEQGIEQTHIETANLMKEKGIDPLLIKEITEIDVSDD